MLTATLIIASIILSTSLRSTSSSTTTTAFLFGADPDQDRCDRIELERCFEIAFQTMRIERVTRKTHSRPSNFDMRNRRHTRGKIRILMPKNQHLCAANRPYLVCFSNEACRDEYTAHIASIVFKRIHERFFPIHMFLAQKGYALQLCSQTCSRESRKHCQQMLSTEQQYEEQGMYRELVGLSKRLSLSSSMKDRNFCQRFKATLRKTLGSELMWLCLQQVDNIDKEVVKPHKLTMWHWLKLSREQTLFFLDEAPKHCDNQNKKMISELVRYRSNFCGEVSKCVCIDLNVQAGVVFCKVGCENVLDEITNIKPRSYTISSKAHALQFNHFFILFILLRLT